jgi:hypothetical protein
MGLGKCGAWIRACDREAGIYGLHSTFVQLLHCSLSAHSYCKGRRVFGGREDPHPSDGLH